MTGARDMIPGSGLAVGAGAGPAGLEISAGVATPGVLGASEGSRAQRPRHRSGGQRLAGGLGGWGAGPQEAGQGLGGEEAGGAWHGGG